MTDDGTIILGARVYGSGNSEPALLSLADRRQHIYLIGKTGVGKSTLLRNLIVQDIGAGRGVGLIDPHGDLALDVLEHIPRSRSHDVAYVDPADLAFPVGLNLLGRVERDRRHLVVSGVLEAFRNFWGDSWGPRLEYILHNTLVALLDYERATLLGVVKMLIDPAYRRRVVAAIADPMARVFWTQEFPGMSEKLRADAIAPIQNKVGRLLGAGPLRNMLGQLETTIDIGRVMNAGQIFVANLSKGNLGADKANLLGSLLLSQFQLASMRRTALPEEERRDFTLYIDEFQNFTTSGFASVLSEARKYRLSLVLAHQYIDQLEKDIRAAIFGNVGSLIIFRVGQADAEILAEELEHEFSPADLTTLGRGETRARTVVEGLPMTPFRMQTINSHGRRHGRSAYHIRGSRTRYGRGRRSIERQIDRMLVGKRRD